MFSKKVISLFVFRSIVLLVLLGIVCLVMVDQFNLILIKAASPFIPVGSTLRTFGTYIEISSTRSGATSPLYLDSLTLYSGTILMITVVLSAVGLRLRERLVSLGILTSLGLVIQLVGIVLLSEGIEAASDMGNPGFSGSRPFNVFSVGWSLVPAIITAVWCYLFWRRNKSATNPLN
ncbi:MAG: hypothetical protein VX426_01185 [Chloroflexota bacterium]|uniref:Uncharacterized protein n=1 Tax=marine metagenome TaxID=408172 RepID=A0A381Y8Z3_9ZZZZ|nr:hypothetical protein [Chloroflexota bacterium]